MKIIFVAVIALASLGQQKCGRQKTVINTTCFKGRLEVKGICSNYTIKLLEGAMDTSKISAAWKDEVTQKTYTNVFALASPCTFPSTINAGDEFYFTLDSSVQNCAVCMAYYPHPPKAVRLKVLTAPCK